MGVEHAWYTADDEYDFYHLKGIADELITKLFVDNQLADNYYSEGDDFYKYGFRKVFGEEVVCRGGLIENELTDSYDISQPVFVFTVNLTALKKIQPEEKSYTELLKFPKVYRDFAVVIEKNIDSGEIISDILASSSKLLKNIKLFDIFEGKSLGENKKSLAFRLEYYDNAATLTEDKVEKEFWKVIDKVKKKFNAQLRG